ncbi:hypothetical protein SAMD00023353_4700200 [Rosellinia necatrix]|uniref:Uncharacterized protein n=1 Tax=Rosellinia necatrix TaxID=77044 RepID=A0A1W2TQN9_ROSNE|nr:hypothetical protein SAMD00023353_4700200 [Rosellinia necatrix]
MLKEFFNSMSNGPQGSEDVAELVVTALGTSGRHYICWKTNSGEYRQRSHGLPTRLQEWLCPADGTTRDFETLQVILLSDDAFWASDKNGEIRNESPSVALKQLRRSLTFHDGNLSSTHQRRLSRGRDFEESLERPRSSTLPATLSREQGGPRRQQQLRPLLSHHARAPSIDKPRLGPAVPVALRRRGGSASSPSPMRPQSIDTTLPWELGVLREQPTPKLDPDPAAPPKARDGNTPRPYHASGPAREKSVNGGNNASSPLAAAAATPVRHQKPAYRDAGMQTDPEPTPTPATKPYREEHCRECGCRSRNHDAQRDSAVSFGLGSKAGSSRRPSFDTALTRPDSGVFDESEPGGWADPYPYPDPARHHHYDHHHAAVMANPIAMGRMQDYFRSATYVLGAALHPQGMG